MRSDRHSLLSSLRCFVERMKACQLWLLAKVRTCMGVYIPGNLPRAFSDMPLSCNGTVSSTPDDIDDALEGCSVGVDSAGVGWSSSSSSSSSSSPIANVPSSGTSLNEGARKCVGLLILSTEPLLLSDRSWGSRALSFLLLFRRSISSCPLSSVKERSAEWC